MQPVFRSDRASPRPRGGGPRAAALALALASVLACAGEPPRPWQRLDLWLDLPYFEDGQGRRTSLRPRRIAVSHGAGEVRDLGKLTPWQRKTFPRVSAGQVRALRQEAGSFLTKSVELGAEPFFSFIPLPDEAAPCRCTYRVSVRQAGRGVEELFGHRSEGMLQPPPETLYVDLGRWAGQRVDLLLTVEGAEDREALWGSPAVYSRGARRPPAAERASGRGPNILLLGIDTLRSDALGAYGRSPSRTPAIDRLAAESDLWLEAYATFNVTVPSFSSILSGLYGKHHGVYDNRSRLPESVRTLAEVFAEAGYGTAAILGALHLAQADLGRGFDVVTYPERHYRGETPVDQAMSWIGLQRDPFFCWIHLYDPHTPHTPPGRFALGFGPDGLFGLGEVERWRSFREPGPVPYAHEVLAGGSELYTAEVAYLDRQIDRLMDFLRSRDLLADTLVVLVADHGENLEEHGIRYAHTGLWETTTHVPMMIRWPGRERRGRRLGGLVQTLDLFPTLLASAGLEAPPGDGRDLRELEREGGRRAVFAEHAHDRGEMVRGRTFKYIVSRENPQVPAGPYLYDLRADPEELENLAGRGLAEEERLARILETWRAARTRHEAEPLVLDPEAEEQLRALGYLG